MVLDLGNTGNESGNSSFPREAKSGYVKPTDVIFPRDRVNEVVQVLYDGGEERLSVAILDYIHDNGAREEVAVAIRWNGTASEPLGFPAVREYAVWFLVPAELASAIRFLAGQNFESEIPFDEANGERYLDRFANQFSTKALAKALKERGYNISMEI